MDYYHVVYNTSTYEPKKWAVCTPTYFGFYEYKTEAAAKRKAAQLNKNRENRINA